MILLIIYEKFKETTKIICSLLDFDKDYYIQKESVKLFLIYLLFDEFNINNNINKGNISKNKVLEEKTRSK